MRYAILADLLVVVHLAFVVFVVLGGLLVLRWRRTAWLHVPAAVWGALIELRGWVCPLTPWENRLRRLAGDAGYTGGFIEHYVLPVLYPGALTRQIQIGLGLAVIVLNVVIYGAVVLRSRGES